MQSDRIHYRSCIFSLDEPHASGGVMIIVRDGLFFSELSNSSLFCLTPTLTM